MWPLLDPPKHFRSNSCIYVGLGSHLLKLSLQALIELNRIKKNDIFEEEWTKVWQRNREVLKGYKGQAKEEVMLPRF